MAGQGYRHAGDIEVNTLQLISAGNQVIDLGELVVQLDLFQSLDDPFMRCEITLDDASAILNTIAGGFTGGELLVVSYKSADDNLETKTHVFVLHEVSGRTKLADNREVYMMNGSSVEMYQDVGYKVSRSFGSGNGALVSEMVEQVVNEYLYNENAKAIYSLAKADVEKTIEVDPTSGNQKYIAPMIRPTQLISRLSREADNENQNPYYFFYEDSKGFKFKDLTTLVSAEPIGQYVYQPKNFDEGTDFYKINSYSVNRQNSFFRNVSDGMLKNRNYQLDIMRREWNVKDTTYEQVAGGFPKLQDSLAPGIVGEDSNPAMFMTISRTGHDIDSRFGGEAPLPKKSSEFAGNSLALGMHISNVELDVELPGDSEIDVGKTIILRIPSSSSTEDQNGADDITLSGKYLITRCRHKTEGSTGGKYQTVIRCIKESGIPADNYNEVVEQQKGTGGSQATGVSGLPSGLPSGISGLQIPTPSLGGIGQTFGQLSGGLGGLSNIAGGLLNGNIPNIAGGLLNANIPNVNNLINSGLANVAGNLGSSVGNLLSSTPMNATLAAVSGKVGGAINKIASGIVPENIRLSLNQPFGDGGLDSVLKGELGGVLSSVEGILNTGDISGLKNKIMAGLPEVKDVISEIDKLGGNIDVTKVANIKDAQQIIDVAAGDFTSSVVTVSDGTDYEVKEIEDNVGKKTNVLVKAESPKVNKTFMSFEGYAYEQYFSYPTAPYTIYEDMDSGKYGEGSKIRLITAYNDSIQDDFTYTIYKNPITNRYAGINLADPDEVARYKRAGFKI